MGWASFCPRPCGPFLSPLLFISRDKMPALIAPAGPSCVRECGERFQPQKPCQTFHYKTAHHTHSVPTFPARCSCPDERPPISCEERALPPKNTHLFRPACVAVWRAGGRKDAAPWPPPSWACAPCLRGPHKQGLPPHSHCPLLGQTHPYPRHHFTPHSVHCCRV